MNSEPHSQPPQVDQSLARRCVPFTERLIRYATEWIEERRYVYHHSRYIDQIERSGELDALLEALDINREQLTALKISPLASAELLARMVEHIGWGVEIPASGRQRAEQQCRSCENWKRCLRWVNRSERTTDYRRFCGNADFFDSLLAARPSCSAATSRLVSPARNIYVTTPASAGAVGPSDRSMRL